MNNLSVIFDIDGVIVDSENLHFDALREVLPTYVNNHTPQELIGLSLSETLKLIGVADDLIPKVIPEIIDTYKRKLDKKYLRPGVQSLIEKLERHAISFGFVSSALRHVCLANLTLITTQSPIKLIAGDDLLKTKPFPDPYIKMLECLQSTPNNTIVIEDSDVGIYSAYQAGISKIYAWPHSLSMKQKYNYASSVISSLGEITELASYN